MYICTDY